MLVRGMQREAHATREEFLLTARCIRLEWTRTSARISAMSNETPNRNRLSLDPSSEKIVVEGVAPFGTKAEYILFKLLVEQHIEDRNSGRAPENYRYTSTRDLADKLNIDEAAVRQRICRLRKLFCAGGLEPIQTKNSTGYRLDPEIWVLARGEIGH
jgi:hypothetical protein